MNSHIALLLNPSPDIESATQGRGRSCRVARTSHEAIEITRDVSSVVDFIVADLDSRNGYEMLAGVAGRCHQTPIIAVSSCYEDGRRPLPMRHPPVVCVGRPLQVDALTLAFGEN